MNDEGRPIKEYGGNFVWRRGEFLPCEETVKDQTFVWQCPGLDSES